MLRKKLLLTLSLISCISLSLMAQTKQNFLINWKKVEALEKKGLTKSALQEVVSIYNLAVTDNNVAQQIKSCMYQVRYRNMVEEDSHENNIFFIDTLVEKAKAPAKNILQSMQAEMFWQYLQNNRWKFNDRTKLLSEKSKDISTWSLDKLYNTITKLYKSSLSGAHLLKTTRIDEFDPILLKGLNTRQLRPTLYDFLTHRALGFFMSDEAGLTKPAYQFKINEVQAFSPAPEFINAVFKTKDSASLQHTSLLLFQDILKFHLNDSDPGALIDADLIRLKFVYEYGIMEEKEKIYETSLINMEEKYPAEPAIAQAMYLRGTIYLKKGQDYNPPTKSENQYEIKKAKALFETTFSRFPRSEGGINAKNSIGQIKQPSLNLQTEQVNIPGLPFRSLVTYKNVKAIYLRIIKTSKEELKKLDRHDYEKLWKAYTEMKPEKSWSVSLPDPQDYREHSAEIKIDGLTNGVYLLFASIDENFSLTKNIIARQLTYISNISYIHNNNNEYYALHRDNGQPLPNTQVQVWESNYNYTTSAYEQVKEEKYTTDKNGSFKLRKSSTYRNFLLQFINGSDELFLDETNNYFNYNSYYPEIKPQTFLFTDRAIYRPGQTVFFKGIVIHKEDNAAKSKVLPNFMTRILLRDANSQKLAEIAVTTNDFGSYKGSFKLPEGLLNGEFSLLDSATNGFHGFSVEEYKRPKFFVEVQKPKGTYRVNDSIKVTGTAKAYAGNNIDDAMVKYRVVRKIQYPIWWNWGYFRGGNGKNEETEIANGELKSNAKGEFIITFKALPDETVDKKSQPIFYYEVSADITDLNGETRSGNTTVAVAYQMLQLNINLPEKLVADSLKDLKISSTNLNDIFEKAAITVTIQKVLSPGKFYRERFWNMPDQFIMGKEEYTGLFPYDVYKDEDKVPAWPLGERVAEKTDSTNENSQWTMGNMQWATGWYKITAVTKDKYGEVVKAEKYIRLVNGLAGKTTEEAITVDVNKPTFEPGDKILYSIKTGFPGIWLIHTLNKMDNSYNTSYLPVSSNQSYQDEIEVNEKDRGGMSVSYAFVQHNRVYKGAENFNIPWHNKDLHISYETFRDKLLPGSEEKWKVKITGNKGEKVSAEIMAGMYDASLDQFKPNYWGNINIWPGLVNSTGWMEKGFSSVQSQEYNKKEYEYAGLPTKSYDALNNFGGGYYGGNNPITEYGIAVTTVDGNFFQSKELPSPPPSPMGREKKAMFIKTGNVNTQYKTIDGDKDVLMNQEEINDTTRQANKLKGQSPNVQVRKNFNETAFFFPELRTDEDGNVEFSFTMPEALTKWKLMTMAHTKDLASAYSEKNTVTQKPLMVQPNAPRFMREGDRINFSAKIVNLGDSGVTGAVQLELIDAATGKPVDGWFKNLSPLKVFAIPAGQSVAVNFLMEVPFNYNSALTYRIKAITNANARGEIFSDGEEMALPVLTNRMLVTESLPLNMRNQNSKAFKFEKLLASGNSASISNHALTIEYTSNPAWYAVQALPYLMEYPYECAEQTFNRYYANALAAHISNSIPKIKNVFEKWKNADTAALLSNLQKNEELKSALLQETPWVLDAQNENQQKKNIALLFDMVRMGNEQDKAINKLQEMQASNGGFVWFTGGPDDRYITQYIITGIGHLRKLNALSDDGYNKIKGMVDKAIPYLDGKIKADYDDLIRYKIKLKDDNLSSTAIQYLYMRSFFSEYKINDASLKAYNYYRSQSQKYWLGNSKYMQAMIALELHRSGDTRIPKDIISSLKENSIQSEEMGMYWKEWTNGGFYWYQAPVESQAMMVEAFSDIDKDLTTTDDLKTWLLKQKQTQSWKTTRATAEACYALLLNGNNWLSEEKEVEISLGNTLIKSTDNASEGGTGYFKKRIEGDKLKPEMGNINVAIKSPVTQNPTIPGGSTSWGSVYWQYFEDLDKITPAETPLKLSKKLFIEKNTDKGPVLASIADGAILKVGDKVKVRIELRVDRDMEYVHMKDMRAACMEPTNVISQYKYQGGLGYYESTKDASTNFFFSWLGRGTYVFEYTMFVTHAGNFSNGITTIQCMYAPEFTSHSEGIRVSVD